MIARRGNVPVFVFSDLERRVPRCINALHVQTFIRNPFGETGTLITFANGDTVTVTEDFDDVVNTIMGDRVGG